MTIYSKPMQSTTSNPQAEAAQLPGAMTLDTEDACQECAEGKYPCVALTNSTRGELRCVGCEKQTCSFSDIRYPLRARSHFRKLETIASLLAQHPDTDEATRSSAETILQGLGRLWPQDTS